MNLKRKIEILADSAKYDVSCSSSGSSRKDKKGKLGNAHLAGICHSWSNDGRCISLLKILMTNRCIYNCCYCVNRLDNDIDRAVLTPEELSDLTINFYRRNYIEGLFLSSGVYKTPDYTMELMIKTVKILRSQYNFNGYIHMKTIPGADSKLVEQAGNLVDRMSVNIELPTSTSLSLLAPQKKKEDILKPMNWISETINETKEDYGKYRANRFFVPAGQTTQLMVGATREHDMTILKLSENLYRRFGLKRVYYSAYMPVTAHPLLPTVTSSPPLIRENRLYQADWLLRFYGFNASELLDEKRPNFDLDIDPKSDWAIRNYNLFPVEINTVDYEMLLRIPGIGIKSAGRIINARRIAMLDFDHLKKLGVVLKRARHFITCCGKYYGSTFPEPQVIKHFIKPSRRLVANDKYNSNQISLFSLYPQEFNNDLYSAITGEI